MSPATPADRPGFAVAQLLTEPEGRLAGLLWRWPTAALATGPHADAWQQLTVHAACFALRNETPAEDVDTLATAGCRLLNEANVTLASSSPTEPGAWTAGPWYLNAPAAAVAGAQAASRQRAFQLLQLVSADADTHDIEEVFRQDAQLSYQLLRLVNSVAFGARREITSFRQAILLVGRQPLKRWLNLLLFTARDDDARGALLMTHVSLRARGMELLAQAIGHDKAEQDQAFIVGMFSLLGVLFGRPLAEVLRPLQLTETLRAAVLERHGPLGQLLQAWETLEAADPQRIASSWGCFPVSASTAQGVVIDACAWAWQLSRNQTNHGTGH